MCLAILSRDVRHRIRTVVLQTPYVICGKFKCKEKVDYLEKAPLLCIKLSISSTAFSAQIN